MYAQLCKRLSEEAPNFEPPGQPCTFKLLLLNKCRTEFENRATAFAAFEDKILTPDEEEKRHLAKCKMLGNIKFIGELGKLEILAESILHRCIQQLLARRAAAEHHEDLECLAQLVRTCGRVLDSERGRGLMDQYFARMETLSNSRDLAPRIRFMLRDAVELRRGGWVPRAALTNEGPVPIQQLHADDELPTRAHHRDHQPPADPLFRHGLRARGLDDVLSGLTLGVGVGGGGVSSPNAHPDKLFGGNGFGAPGVHRQRSPLTPNYQRVQNAFGKHHQNASNSGGGSGSKESAGGGGGGGGRFGKGRSGVSALEDVQMRPAANSLLFTANKLSKQQPPHPPLATTHQQHPQNVVTASFASAPPLLKEPSITIKQTSDKNAKPKKDKGVSKEEASRAAVEAARVVAAEAQAQHRFHIQGHAQDEVEAEGGALGEQVRRLRDLQLPDKLLRRVIAALLEHALTDVDSDAETDDVQKEKDIEGDGDGEGEGDVEGEVESAVVGVSGADRLCWSVSALIRGVKRAPVLEAVRSLVSSKHPHRRLPPLLAHAINQKLCTLSEVSSLCENGQHYPLLLEVLQHMRDLLGIERLILIYNESKINLTGCLKEGVSLSEAVDSNGLGALVPQLRVQAELARQLAAEPAPANLYRWIKSNVEPSVRHNAAFVSTLIALLAEYITGEAGSGGGTAEKSALEREKALVEAYAPLLTALVAGRAESQLAAVYAVQVHAHHHHYPKGLLLRWFMHLYNLEVCEEEAFLRWREDVTDAYPGKGEALFQVNTWLTWLQQQESEEEEADD